MCKLQHRQERTMPEGTAYPRVSQVHTHQAKHERPHHNQHAIPPAHKKSANSKLSAQLAYIVTDVDCGCGRYLNVFLTYPNIRIYGVSYSTYFDYGVIQPLISRLY